MIACIVKACTPEAKHIYTGLFPSKHIAWSDAYKRFGFHTTVMVTSIGQKPTHNTLQPTPPRAA